MHYTDLQIDMDSVLFDGSVTDRGALLVKVSYANKSGGATRFTLPDRATVSAPSCAVASRCLPSCSPSPAPGRHRGGACTPGYPPRPATRP
jgi:hypothetical protein